WMGGCKDQNVAVPVFGDNYIGSQPSSVQHTGYVSLLQSIDKDVGSYNHLYKSGSEFSGNIPPLNVDGVIDQRISSP
ncbi:hypothetical protein PIB30_113998, partial [Stylosanthes scabra]|nr:hypothetical protein [Stylosanthes scabra]